MGEKIVKKRTGEPWMSADDYGRSLSGIGFNLLVSDMARALEFQREVLLAKVLYADEDFAAIELMANHLMLHTDHTYDDHPMSGIIRGVSARGAGVELRVYGLDPDAAQARADKHGFTVLAGAMDKPHGLRECFVIDDEGYVWSPSAATT